MENSIILATINAKWIHPSLALRLLKANLGTLAEQTTILEFALRQPLKEKVDVILSSQPRILALSVSIWNHTATLELLETLSREWKAGDKSLQKPLVVLGGPEVSWLPPEAEIFHYADYVIRGEGEESFRLLCYRIFNLPRENLTPRHIEPSVRDAEENEFETMVTPDLSIIASAYHLYTDEDLSSKHIYVEASRGCPFTCEFCQASVKKHGLQAVREFPLEPFLLDMETLIKRGGRIFKFLDRTFNLNIERAKRIMDFFLERIDTVKTVHFEMVPSRFPQTLRETIRRFPPGTLRLELEIQTLNPEVKALIRVSRETNEELEALEFLRRETKAIVHADLIAGLPGENYTSFGAGFDRLWQVMSGITPGNPGTPVGNPEPSSRSFFEIQLGILKCLPGTPIIRHNETYGMRYSCEPPYEVIETKALPAAELEKIKNFARFWEILVNRNPFPDLIPRLVPPGKDVFDRFMDISDKLLKKFGRNWE